MGGRPVPFVFDELSAWLSAQPCVARVDRCTANGFDGVDVQLVNRRFELFVSLVEDRAHVTPGFGCNDGRIIVD